MFCTKCGRQNPEGSTFCNHCGEPLISPGLGERRYKLQSSRKRRGPNASRLPLLFAALLVLICAVVVVIYVLVVGPSNQPASNEIVRIELDPVGKQMDLGATQAFIVIGYTKDNAKNSFTEGIAWSVNPSNLGKVDEKGVFKPSQIGDGEIVATYQSKSGEKKATAKVSVKAGVAIERITISPATANLAVGEEQVYQVKAVDTTGAEVTIQAKWMVLEPNQGTIDQNGTFKAAKIGNATIIASYTYNNKEVSGSAVAIVRDGPATPVRRIEVIPPSIELKLGEIYQFIIKGYDKDNKEVAVSAQWQLVGDVGKIDGNGNFTAEKEGAGTVEALANGLSATAEVIVSVEGISFQSYNDSALPFTFKYPSNWEIEAGNTMVRLFAPTQTDTKFAYTAIFGYEEIAVGKDLATYAQENEAWAAGRFTECAFSQEDRLFGDTNGKVIPFSATGYKGILGCAVNGTTGYYFFSYAPEKNYPQLEGTFRQMVNSWFIPKSITPTATLTPSSPLTPSPTPTGNTVRNDAFGFSFSFPEGWQQGNLPGVAAYVTGPVTQNYLPNQTVKVEELAVSMTPEQFAEKIEKERLKNFYDNYQSLTLESVNLGGQPAYKRVFTISFQGQPLQEIQYYIVRGTRGYLVTFDISLDAFPALNPVFDQIAGSFSFF